MPCEVTTMGTHYGLPQIDHITPVTTRRVACKGLKSQNIGRTFNGIRNDMFVDFLLPRPLAVFHPYPQDPCHAEEPGLVAGFALEIAGFVFQHVEEDLRCSGRSAVVLEPMLAGIADGEVSAV